MGLTFKENCPDLRNTRVIDVINGLKEYNADIDIYDPWVDNTEAFNEYGISLIDNPQSDTYDAVIITVAHDQFKTMGLDTIKKFAKNKSIIFDVKYIFPKQDNVYRL
jgi:UDP-N-acetyl-D-galactosamine dehydrogenase